MKVHTFSFTTQMVEGMYKSERYKKVQDVFALDDERVNERRILETMDLDLSGIVYITGFSGSGKSTLLSLIREEYPDVVLPQPPADPDVPIIDLIGDTLEAAIQLLGWVGLGEAYLYLTPYRALSEGQKARFQLALALNQQPNMLLVDEFLSNLDRITAKVVAYSFQKTCRKLGVSVVVATAHDDLTEALAPDTQVTLDLSGVHQIDRLPVEQAFIPELRDLEVVPGTFSDYEQLKRFHYFGGTEFAEEGMFDLEIYAMHYQQMCIGVCVLMSPYPSDWNEVPYFQEVNERVKCIVRAVVHPSFRGAGLAKPLIRPAISQIQYIETRSALGLYMPMYLAGGFRRVELPSNHVSPKRQALWDKVQEQGTDDSAELLAQAQEVYVEMIFENNLFLREIVDLPPLSDEERQELWDILFEACDELPLEDLLEETLYFKMQGFVVKHR